jgi:hypothetical protein
VRTSWMKILCALPRTVYMHCGGGYFDVRGKYFSAHVFPASATTSLLAARVKLVVFSAPRDYTSSIGDVLM